MKVVLYTKPTCPFCLKSKALLKQRGIEFEDYDVSNDSALRKKISASVGGYSTVPMIFLDDKFIGGNSELQTLDSQGKLSF